MATYATAVLYDYARQDDALRDYPSSVHSGIIGDAAHRRSNSYHNSLNDNPNKARGSYTNRYPDDQMPTAGSANHASATDKSMSTADMVREWNRYLAVFHDHSDPRRKYIAEYIGWNGRGEAERLDFQANTRTVSTKDHKWHSHKARRRRYYNSVEANKAFLSIDRGETKQQYINSFGKKDDVSKVIQYNQQDGNKSWYITDGKSRRHLRKWEAIEWWSQVCGQEPDDHTVSSLDELLEFAGPESGTTLTQEQFDAFVSQVTKALVDAQDNSVDEQQVDAVANKVREVLESMRLTVDE